MNSTTLSAVVPANNLTFIGTSSITVFTPGAGGGTSNPAAFQLTGGACDSGANAVVRENCLNANPPTNWSANNDPSILGFSTDISVNKGTTVSFKVNTNATNYRIEIYRVGFYSGQQARLVGIVVPSASLPQSQPACLNDSTGLNDCGNWAVSGSWGVPANAVSGIYIASLVRTDTGGRSYIPFVVRDDAGNSGLLFQTSDLTWQAYNSYLGNSLYTGSPASRAYKVSYNRPILTNDPMTVEAPMVRYLEANGYDVSYSTGVDTARQGSLLLNHKIFLAVGHDEYVSGPQRSNIEAARAAGVHLAFFSGNEVFWKTRWENSIDGSSTPYRTEVCYKESQSQARIDPLDPPDGTGLWRDPLYNAGGKPENALTGQSSISAESAGQIYPLNVRAEDGQLRFWRNTSMASLAVGSSAFINSQVIGWEWDEDADNGFRPAGLMQLSSTTIQTEAHFVFSNGLSYTFGRDTHHLTLYRAASGALVFGAGTIYLPIGLDPMSQPDLRLQQAIINLFADMGAQPATLMSGLAAATASIDVTAPTSSITTPTSGTIVVAGQPLTIQGTASDTGGGVVAGVEVSSDNGVTWHPAVGRANWSYTWVPPSATATVLRSRAVDDSGNLATPSAGIPLAGDSTPPVVTIITPTSNASVLGTVSVMAQATDNSGFVQKVEFYLDNGLQVVDSSSPYTWTWDSTQGLDGTHTVTAKAYDSALNSSVSTITVVVQNALVPVNIQSSTITFSSATISWNTTLVSDSQVEYGTSAGYGSTTAINSSLVSTHVQALTGLQSLTLYHYRVKSRGVSGNLAVSTDHTFSTGVAGAAGVWTFDDGSGSTAADVSGNLNNGAVQGGAAWVLGKSGTALSLNGTNQYVSVPDASSLRSMPQLTLAAWVNKPSQSGYVPLIAKWNNGSDYAYWFGFYNDQLHEQIVFTNGADLARTSLPIPLNQWTHVALVYPGDGTPARLYINGARVMSFVVPPSSGNSAPVSGSAAPVTLGYYPTRFLQGALDDVRIYGRALSDAEIQGLAGLTSLITVAISSPANNATVSGTVPVAAAASGGNGGVTKVEFYVDGVLKVTDNSTPYTFNWDTTQFPNGTHTITVKAYDSALNNSSASIVLNVAGSPYIPTFPFVTFQSASIVRNNISAWIGMKFTVGAFPVRVVSLARFQLSHNVAAHTVKLVDASTGLDVPGGSVVVPNSAVANQFSYAALPSPISLPANRAYYLVSAEIAGNDEWYDVSQMSLQTTADAVCNGPVYNSGTGYVTWSGPNQDYGPVSFTYQLQSPPSITNVTGVPSGPSTMIVSWTTNTPADSQVEFGTSTAYGSSTARDGSLVTNHSQVLSGLTSGTLYHYRVRSADINGFLAISADFSVVCGNGQNPVPSLGSLSPSRAALGGPAFTLTVNGSSFVSGATVQWNGSTRPTTFISGTQLNVQISSTDIAVSTQAAVTVVNPAPGGGTSGTLLFSVADASLGGYWRLDEGVGSLASDSSLFSNDGTIVGGAAWVPGKAGTALSLNGTNQYVSVPDASSLRSMPQLTLAAWVNKPSQSGYVPLIAKWNNGSDYAYWFGFYNDQLHEQLVLNSGSDIARTSLTIPLNQWTHVALVYPGDGTPTRIYINGARVTNFIVPPSPGNSAPVGASAAPVTLGYYPTRFLQGALDDVRIYRRALSDTEIQGLTGLSAPITVAISTPANNATVSGIVPVAATASGGNGGVTKVEFYVDGLLKVTDNSTPYTFNWDTTQFPNGTHTITAKAYDSASSTAISSNTVVVNNVAGLNPVPAALALSPNKAALGGPAFTLTVNGSSFVSGATVQWNGSTRPTTFISGTQLNVQISSTDIAVSTQAAVTVVNPAPGGGTSGTLLFSVADASLGGYWRFDEGVGSLAGDSSLSGNDGTISGGATWTTGVFKGALSFDGASARVTVPDAPSLGSMPQLTLSAWVNKPSQSGYVPLIAKWNNGSDYGYWFGLFNDQIHEQFVTNSGSDIARTSVAIPLNQWTHVALVYPGDGTPARIYINGARVMTFDAPPISGLSTPIVANTAPVTLGYYPNSFLQGVLDDVRIYRRALSDTEIQTLSVKTSSQSTGTTNQIDLNDSTTMGAPVAFGTAFTVRTDPARADTLGGVAYYAAIGTPQFITFEDLPPQSTIEIFTSSGDLVRRLDTPGGTAAWDLRTDAGESVASGYYFYLITTPSNGSIKGVLAIIH